MKKKLLALVCALALTVSLVGCALSTPDTVGKIGDFEVTSGLYLLAQYDAYQQAAQLADSEQDTSKVNSFLKATITTDADTGETAVVKDYVAQKTLETLQTLAAVDARFAELGGELTEEQKSAADSYAQQLMDNYGDAYTANGIGLETLKLFQQLQYKQTLLLDLVYGKDGETPVEDGELTEHLDSTMYEIGFITVPLYNTSTFAFATDDQKAEMLSLAQKAADSYNAAAPEDASSQMAAFNSIASSALTDICAVLDAEVPSTSTLQTDLLSESDLTDAFTQEGAADTLRGLAYGQAAAIQYTGYAMMLAVRLDPLSVSTLDALRSQILSDMKGEELNDALAAYGMLHADGTPQLDANTGTQAVFDNLLILYSGSSLRDDGRTLDYDLSMGGGVWLNGGHLWQVTWTQGTQSTLALYDSNGKPLNLPAGRSYIALLSSLTGQELLVQSSTGEALVGAG